MRWIAVFAVYGAALALFAVLIAVENDTGARTKLVEEVVFVVVPALAFLAGAVPLRRGTRNRVILVAAALVSIVVALGIAILSWGFLLPLSFALLAIALVDLDRVLTISGLAAHRRTFGLAAALVVAGALLGLAAPIAALLIVVGVGVAVWKLIALTRFPSSS